MKKYRLLKDLPGHNAGEFMCEGSNFILTFPPEHYPGWWEEAQEPPTLLEAVCIFLESTRFMGIGVKTIKEGDYLSNLFTALRSAYEREREKERINGQNK